jgi:hypothetical protein
MSSDSLHPLPRYRAIAGEELRAVGIALRREWVLFFLGLGFLTLIFGLNEIREGRNPDMRSAFNMNLGVLIPLTLLGLFAPLSVWKAEGPSHRGYHWAMPIDRLRHTVAKAFAGWGWLMLLVTIFLLWGVLLSSVTGGGVGVWSERVARQSPSSTTQMFAVVYHRMAPWQWLVPYTAMTLTYITGSIFALASDRPWLWIAGVFVGFFILLSTLDAAGFRAGLDSILTVIYGRFGLATAITGIRTVGSTILVGGRSLQVRQDAPEVLSWLASTAIWTMLALGGFLWAAHRHPDD